MAELTSHEKYVLAQVRKWHKHYGGPVPSDLARGIDFYRPCSYDQATRALRSLVSKGLLSKPRRGRYLPTEETMVEQPGVETANPAGSPRVRDTTPPGGSRLSTAWTRNAPTDGRSA